MSGTPSLVFIPGSWHKPACYDKVIKILRDQHEQQLRRVAITLPSTSDNPGATFKDDIDAVRAAITAETAQGRDVVVIAHSYGGMVGNSAIRGLTPPPPPPASASTSTTDTAASTDVKTGHVVALVLIASGFTITGFAFMDPFMGIPPPGVWRVNKHTGYAELICDPRRFFYHDLAPDEAEYWTGQLVTQSLKALFEGGEHAYAGWRDVPAVWYIGTSEDQGLPVLVQRVQVGTARALGAQVNHIELKSSHSPFLSLPEEVAAVISDAVRAVSKSQLQTQGEVKEREGRDVALVRLAAPGTWFKFGIPYFVGRVLGWGIAGFLGLRRLLRR